MSYIFQVLRDKEFETGSSKASSGKNLDSGVFKQRQVSSQSDHMQSKQVLLHSRDCMDGPHATPPFEASKHRKWQKANKRVGNLQPCIDLEPKILPPEFSGFSTELRHSRARMNSNPSSRSAHSPQDIPVTKRNKRLPKNLMPWF